jgi:hypothetical protein
LRITRETTNAGRRRWNRAIHNQFVGIIAHGKIMRYLRRYAQIWNRGISN